MEKKDTGKKLNEIYIIAFIFLWLWDSHLFSFIYISLWVEVYSTFAEFIGFISWFYIKWGLVKIGNKGFDLLTDCWLFRLSGPIGPKLVTRPQTPALTFILIF